MVLAGGAEPIHTARLELVVLTASFVAALVDGDLAGAGRAIGASVTRSLAAQPGHFVQLSLVQARRDAGPTRWFGRAIVQVDRRDRRRVIGSIGFHGPPDERGRLEIGCRIHPAYRGRGYAGEAMTAMFEWASTGLGITRFLVSVSPDAEPRPLVAVDLAPRERGASLDALDGVTALMESSQPAHE